jgi:hypothetical protein
MVAWRLFKQLPSRFARPSRAPQVAIKSIFLAILPLSLTLREAVTCHRRHFFQGRGAGKIA